MIGSLFIILLISDICSGLFLLRAGSVCFRVLIGWEPGQATRRQLTLERDCDATATTILIGSTIYGIVTVLFVVSIAVLLKDDVPGAMCGTGVLQGMAPYGSIALALRLLTVCGIFVLFALHRINQRVPTLPLMIPIARGFLLILPAAIPGIGYTIAAFRVLADATSVSCCAILYETVSNRPVDQIHRWIGIGNRLDIALACASVAVLWAAIRAYRDQHRIRTSIRVGASAFVVLWVVLSVQWMLQHVAPYCFHVLHHHCLWCLFLPIHHAPGFGFLAIQILLISEWTVAFTIPVIEQADPEVTTMLDRRMQRASLRVIVLLVTWWIACGTYPLVWRWVFGVWISG